MTTNLISYHYQGFLLVKHLYYYDIRCKNPASRCQPPDPICVFPVVILQVVALLALTTTSLPTTIAFNTPLRCRFPTTTTTPHPSYHCNPSMIIGQPSQRPTTSGVSLSSQGGGRVVLGRWRTTLQEAWGRHSKKESMPMGILPEENQGGGGFKMPVLPVEISEKIRRVQRTVLLFRWA